MNNKYTYHPSKGFHLATIAKMPESNKEGLEDKVAHLDGGRHRWLKREGATLARDPRPELRVCLYMGIRETYLVRTPLRFFKTTTLFFKNQAFLGSLIMGLNFRTKNLKSKLSHLTLWRCQCLAKI